MTTDRERLAAGGISRISDTKDALTRRMIEDAVRQAAQKKAKPKTAKAGGFDFLVPKGLEDRTADYGNTVQAALGGLGKAAQFIADTTGGAATVAVQKSLIPGRQEIERKFDATAKGQSFLGRFGAARRAYQSSDLPSRGFETPNPLLPGLLPNIRGQVGSKGAIEIAADPFNLFPVGKGAGMAARAAGRAAADPQSLLGASIRAPVWAGMGAIPGHGSGLPRRPKPTSPPALPEVDEAEILATQQRRGAKKRLDEEFTLRQADEAGADDNALLADQERIAREIAQEEYEAVAGTPEELARREAERKAAAEAKRLEEEFNPQQPGSDYLARQQYLFDEDYDMAGGNWRPTFPGQPPPPTPPSPPQGAAPMPRPEVARSLDQARALVALDRPKVNNWLDKNPLLRKIANMERPSRNMPEHIITSYVAQNSARAEIAQAAFRTRVPLLNQIDAAFGKGVSSGEKANVQFVGTPEEAMNHITGTFKDIADNPDLYILSPEQQRVLAALDQRNDELLDLVTNGYGAQIGRFDSKPGGAFLPNSDWSDEAQQAAEAMSSAPASRTIPASGRAKERVYQTARERMAVDDARIQAGKLKPEDAFVPNTNVGALLRGLDGFKASAGSGEVFREGVGGVPEAAWKHSEFPNYKSVEVGPGNFRRFPAEEAAQIKNLQAAADKSGFYPFMADVQATVLGGDFSPFTIQGLQMALFHPAATAKAFIGGKWAMRPEQLARLVAQDPQGWQDFAFATGRSFQEPVPEEFSAGFIGKKGVGKINKKAGAVVDDFATNAYNLVTALAKTHFDADVRMFKAEGASHADAIAAAADNLQKIVPQINPSRYGWSAKHYQIRRAPLTSISFMRKSGELLADATRGYGKIIARKKLTPQERLGVRTINTGYATAALLSVGTAVAEAERLGQDPMQAAKDAVNPNSPRFLNLVIVGTERRIPLGGPVRALFLALAPGEVEGVPFPVPFDNMYRYIRNRVTPGLQTALHAIENKDARGEPIYERGEDNGLEVAMKIALYLAESSLPSSAQQIAGGIRRSEAAEDIAYGAGFAVLGQNIMPLTGIGDLRKKWKAELDEYETIPTIDSRAKEQGMMTRDQARKKYPDLDAKLFVTGHVRSLQSPQAAEIALQLMKENRVKYRDVPGLQPSESTSARMKRIQAIFREELAKTTSGERTASKSSPSPRPPQTPPQSGLPAR